VAIRYPPPATRPVAQPRRGHMFKIHLLFFFLEIVANLKSKENNKVKLDFCLTVHHQLDKVIQMNQLDATMIY